MNFLSVSYDFLDALGIQIKEGRNFSSKFPADTMNNGIPKGPLDQNIGSTILNETAVKDLGIPEPVVGKQVLWGDDGDTMYYVTVVGVAKDFHFTSLRNQIKPFAFVNIPQRVANFTIKLSTDNIKQSLAQLENTWKKFSADRPFEYNFLDETYAGLYQSESRFQKVFISLVVLGIIIACLGLFGLATFAAQQRVKEIGIRKVLGASVSNLIGLLSKDFLKLVIIALIFAVPIAWFAMDKWLQDFAYRINIHWWVFMIAAFITVFIAWITISTQAFKAAASNPVKSFENRINDEQARMNCSEQFPNSKLKAFFMLTNYLKLAFRNLTKRKGYSLLNIAGLAIGIACCVLIFQYVAYERSYDSFPEKADQIVRLRLDAYQQGKLAWKSATSYPAFGPTLKKDFPEVEDYCRLIDADLLLSNEERNVKFNEEKGYYADPSFLSMFNLQLIKGNPKTALNAPGKILLSEKTAKKYFGNDDPMGKRLVYRDPEYTTNFEVTGIFKEFPSNSHLIINHLVSYSSLGSRLRQQGDTTNATETNFGWYDFYTYLQMKQGTDLKKFESKLPAYCDKYINNGDWQKKNNVRDELYVIPLRDIYLYSNFNQEAEVNGNGQSVAFLFLIAFLIIGIAWINYINLATARSLERAREVGIRKVAGAIRKNLIIQFMVESFMLNLVALVVAGIIVFLLTPWFNHLTGKTGAAGFISSKYWMLFLIMFIGGSVLSGLYPAFVLSGFKPVSVLKGLFKNTASGYLLQKGTYHHAICNLSSVDRRYHHRISAGKLYAQPKFGG